MTAWPPNSSNTIVKFADDTTVIGLITATMRTAYREELIVDFRRRQREEHAPLSINGTTVERVNSFRFLGFTSVRTSPRLITLTSSQSQPDSGSSSSSRLQEAQHGLKVTLQVLQVHHREILTGCITAWYSSCTALNREALQRVVKAAQHITRTELPSMEDLYTQRSAVWVPCGSCVLFGSVIVPKNIKDRYVALDFALRGPTLEPGLGLGLAGERLVAGSLPTGPGWAQPEMADVGPPSSRLTTHAERSMRGRCNVVWVAVVAGASTTQSLEPKLWQ
ncbi:hypothetical protein L3Q82_016661 [Scortum barcoo]|uniref:Uncharacterized protein n=1 Tax=Scortum barcoo TaxID=214431 RepID=A0ACB8X854_9TELE|nr:hypothetical protein L3Q82_016661 [Scortum barcoo]